MSRSLKILIVALIGAACTASAPDAAPPQQKPTPPPSGQLTTADIPMSARSAFGEIKLAKVADTCVVESATTSVHARHGQTVKWMVENLCTTEQTLELRDFRDKFSGVAVFPFDKAGIPACTAQPGRHCHIILKVLDTDPNGGSLNKVYTYGFGKKGGDPELVIEWP